MCEIYAQTWATWADGGIAALERNAHSEENDQTREFERIPVPLPKNSIQVARTDEIAYFRIRGKGTMGNALLVENMAAVMAEDGYWKFLFDLEGCRGMDSTFIGTILGIALTVKHKKDGWVCIANADRTCAALLTTLGVSEFVRASDGLEITGTIETEELVEKGPPGKEQYLGLIKKAHKNLIKIDRRNRKRFGNFLSALEREMSAR